MTDAEYLFKTDCSEKKRIARSANKTNRVGKGPVRLPSDNLTRKEIRNMSGDIKNYNLNQPISFSEFKTWPLDIQQAYLDNIKSKFDPTYLDLARMFDCGETEVIKYLKYGDLKWVGSNRRRSLINNKDSEWLKWCYKAPEKPIVKETVPPILGGKVELCGTLEEITRTLRNICHEDYSYVFKITFKDGMKVK